VPAACAILEEAVRGHPTSEEIWLAAFKLEFENQSTSVRAGCWPRRARRGGTERVWMKSAIPEREVGNVEEEARCCRRGCSSSQGFHKLWLMLGQLEARQGRLDAPGRPSRRA